MCGFMHWHTIFRTNWHYVNNRDTEFDIFYGMKKLLDQNQDSDKFQKTIKFRSDIVVKRSELVNNLKIVREFVLQKREVEKGALSTLGAILFKMTSVTKY